MKAVPRDIGWTGAALLAAVAVGLAIPYFVDSLRVLGRYIPQERIELDYLWGLVWATTIAISIRFWPIPAADRRPLLFVWIAKCLVTLGAMLAYEWNYTLDAYAYFRRSSTSDFPALINSWSYGTDVVSQFAWLHARAFPNSYHAMKVTFAAIGLIAVYLIYRAAVKFMRGEDHRILYWIGLFPSILFWSSILGKEPLHLFGIALYAYGILSWRTTGRSIHVLTIAAGLIVAVMIRSWSGPILLFPLAVFAVFGLPRMWMRIAFGVVAVVVFGLAVREFADTFNIQTLRDVQAAAEARSHGWQGGSAQRRAEEFTGIGSMLRFAPVGAFTALFRPLPGEVKNPFGVVAGLENLLLLGLVVVALARMRVTTIRDPVIVWSLVLIATWSFVYSFVSYYNFGAAVRFKLQILPVLLLVLLYLARRPTGRKPESVGEPVRAANSGLPTA